MPGSSIRSKTRTWSHSSVCRASLTPGQHPGDFSFAVDGSACRHFSSLFPQHLLHKCCVFLGDVLCVTMVRTWGLPTHLHGVPLSTPQAEPLLALLPVGWPPGLIISPVLH